MATSQQLRERLTGAAVLVMLGIIFIPEFLSGPREESTGESQALILPGAVEQPTRTHTIHVDDDLRSQPPVARSVPSQTETQPTAKQPVTAVKQAVSQSATKQKPATGEATAIEQDQPVGARGEWAVQTGSFSNLENARRQANSLASMGYGSYLSETTVAGRTLHRVRIGPMRTREAADQVARELQQQGQPAKPVPNP